MLILTRREGERLMIGDNIEIEVLKIVGNQVRIGIEAPREIAVHREEVYRRIAGTEVEADEKPKDKKRATVKLRPRSTPGNYRKLG